MVTARPEDILAAGRIVLPGVGHFADCAGALRAIPARDLDQLHSRWLQPKYPRLTESPGLWQNLSLLLGLLLLASAVGSAHSPSSAPSVLKRSTRAGPSLATSSSVCPLRLSLAVSRLRPSASTRRPSGVVSGRALSSCSASGCSLLRVSVSR